MKITKLISMLCTVSLLMLGYSAPVFSAGTFPVSASGDTTGETDHLNIAAAFADAQAAGDGSTVQLGAGTFYIRKPIQAANFVGTLQGAGKNDTFIRNPIGRGIANSDPPAPPGGHPLMFYQDASWPEGVVQDITLRDFTVGVDELPIPWGTVIAGFLTEQSFSNLIIHLGRITGTDDASEVAYVSFTVDSVGLEGFGISDYGIQPANIFQFQDIGPVEIDYKGETLLVRAIEGYGAPWKQLSGDLLVVNGLFNDLLLTAVSLGHGTHPDFYAHVENNTTNDASLVYAENWSPWVPLTLVVSGTEINQKLHSYYAGIEAWGAGIELLAEQNRIHGEDTALWGPIFTNGLNNAVISNNQITGRGPAAIYIGVDYWGYGGNSGCNLIGNNVQGWDTQPWEWLTEIAPIWLGFGTSNCTVVGNGKNVANDGTDNTVTGMNNIGPVVPPDTLGQAISAAQKRRSGLH